MPQTWWLQVNASHTILSLVTILTHLVLAAKLSLSNDIGDLVLFEQALNALRETRDSLRLGFHHLFQVDFQACNLFPQ